MWTVLIVLFVILDILYMALIYGKEYDPIEKYGNWIERQTGFRRKLHNAILYIIAAILFLPFLLLMSIGRGDY